eukprot:10698141-Ditylum_brightwellii.AAC.1
MAQFQQLPKHARNTGATGSNTSGYGTRTSSWTTPLNWKEASSLPHLMQGSGQAYTAEDISSKFHLSWRHSQQYPRPSNWLENLA